MHYEILDQKRLALLPLFQSFKEYFYLAGGTALALQIGHRDSVDFDFFCEKDIDTQKLFERLRKTFTGHAITKIQEEENTLTVIVDDSVKLSFFTYAYKLLEDTVDSEHIRLASLEDIACMKLSAITGRATTKDYVDIYFILEKFSLSELLDFAHEKFPELDRNLILKSLIYFDDIIEEPIMYKNNMDIPFKDVQERMRLEVKKFAKIL